MSHETELGHVQAHSGDVEPRWVDRHHSKIAITVAFTFAGLLLACFFLGKFILFVQVLLLGLVVGTIVFVFRWWVLSSAAARRVARTASQNASFNASMPSMFFDDKQVAARAAQWRAEDEAKHKKEAEPKTDFRARRQAVRDELLPKSNKLESDQ